jgi:hypothetical protein
MVRLLRRKRVALPLGLVAALVVAGVAFAYFTSTGTGTGTAAVGSATTWTVTPAAATGGPLYPGSGSQTISYTVTNPSTGHQALTGTTAVVATSGLNVTHAGVAVPGCLASWFTAVNTAPASLPQDLAAGGTSTAGSVVVTMTDAAVAQNACAGISPDITISAS